MVRSKLYLLGALTLGTLSIAWGSSPAIGTATANGAFAVNQTQVTGSAKLFDGAVVETGAAASRVALDNGSRIELNAQSALAVRATEAELTKGSGTVGAAGGFVLRARTLRIETEGAQAEVRLNGARNVVVTAMNGPVRVFSKTGVPVAVVTAGMGMTFDPFAAAAGDFDMSGCLVKQSAGSLHGLVAENTRFQVMGDSLASLKGSRIHVVGTRMDSAPALKGASVAVQVSKVELLEAGGCAAAAAAWPETEKMDGGPAPGTPGTAGTKGAKSKKPLIIAGVAVAAGGGITAAALLSKSR
jgi:ferric-dicitrate binding protein FerR (iron transport regulator)